ncbi:hypothetical protein D9615_007037 [Tricholomella constricta]|uniref:Uncharacterized protein n=1 Tax=Tricholomella constricta TaxID=117010 RepID=A0A8H5H892_9AGAR|nr:hypothetical protein D9615_007037 [Tricholomella constricta]
MSPDERALLQLVGFVMLENFAVLASVVLLYGMFIMLFAFSTFTLLRRGLASRSTQAMLGLTLIAFLACSVICISYIVGNVIGVKGVLVDSAGILDESILARVNKRTTLITIITIVTPMVLSILSDSVVIWRAWVLYPDKQWIMLVPCALLFGTIGVTIAYLVIFLKGVQYPALQPILFLASLTFSLATNVVATSLIFYKLWGHLRFLRRMGIKQNSTSSAQKILIVLVDTGLAYCALQITVIGLEFAPTPQYLSMRQATLIVLFVLNLVTGMYPSIVIVLVSLQRSTVETFGFGTQIGIQTVQDIEISPARPASPGHLSVAVTPLEGKTDVSPAAACVPKEANADGGPPGTVSATSNIGAVVAAACDLLCPASCVRFMGIFRSCGSEFQRDWMLNAFFWLFALTSVNPSPFGSSTPSSHRTDPVPS